MNLFTRQFCCLLAFLSIALHQAFVISTAVCSLMDTDLPRNSSNRILLPSTPVLVNATRDSICTWFIEDSKTCCPPPIESTLKAVDSQRFYDKLIDNIDSIEVQLRSYFETFSEQWLKFLQRQRRTFHRYFTDYFGSNYADNEDLSDQLFADFERLFAERNVEADRARPALRPTTTLATTAALSLEHRLRSILDRFYAALLQRLYRRLLSQPVSSSHMECATNLLRTKLSLITVTGQGLADIQASFESAVLFNQSLSRIASRLMQKVKTMVSLSDVCERSLTTVQRCGLCNQIAKPPCPQSCEFALKICLAPLANVQNKFQALISNLKALAVKLSGPFSLDRVLDPLKTYISEFVMQFHNSSTDLLNQVSSQCAESASELSATSTPAPPARPARPRAAASRLADAARQSDSTLPRILANFLQGVDRFHLWKFDWRSVCPQSHPADCWNVTAHLSQLTSTSTNSPTKRATDSDLENDVVRELSDIIKLSEVAPADLAMAGADTVIYGDSENSYQYASDAGAPADGAAAAPSADAASQLSAQKRRLIGAIGRQMMRTPADSDDEDFERVASGDVPDTRFGSGFQPDDERFGFDDLKGDGSGSVVITGPRNLSDALPSSTMWPADVFTSTTKSSAVSTHLQSFLSAVSWTFLAFSVGHLAR